MKSDAEMVAEWRAAMEGVTPGPWRVDHNHIHYVVCDHAPMVISFNRQAPTDSAWVARCSPSGISDLLALIESQRATIERVERELVAKKAECEVWRVEAEDLKTLDGHAEWVRLDALLSEEYEKTEALEARVTALEAEKAGDGWLDISTAPKDGTPILMGFPAEGEKPGAVFDGWWDRESGGWVDGDTDNYDDLRVYRHITHWQPLPAPPQALSRSSTEVKNDG